MLEDAQRGNFDRCYLATSDADFLPVIEAVRRLGKMVVVLGYREGLGNHSPLTIVPDFFYPIDESFMRLHYEVSPATIPNVTRRLGDFLVNPSDKTATLELQDQNKRLFERFQKFVRRLEARTASLRSDDFVSSANIQLDESKVEAIQRVTRELQRALHDFDDLDKDLSSPTQT